jgi:hypothetical protein
MNEITGIIDHRILLNFRVNPDVMQRALPDVFRPKVVSGYAIGGICQVSLSKMRAKGLPEVVGTRSHNAAHRIAVVGPTGDGVFVPRRDTDSFLNKLAGGRLFPGIYSRARFNVGGSGDEYSVTIHDRDQNPIMSIAASVVDRLPAGSVFSDMNEASDFFLGGNLGWSPRPDGQGFDTIEMITHDWRIEPLYVTSWQSAFFSDESQFPAGSVEFDGAMIMRNIPHSWVSRERLCEACC